MSDFEDIINNKIKNFFSIIDNKIILIENRVNKLENITNELLKHNNNIKITTNSNIINLEKQEMNITNDVIKKALIYKDYRTVLYLFKYFYKNKLNQENAYPIKIKGKRMFEYYNNQWISDSNAHYIKNTLFMNIQTELYKFNNFDNVDDIDDIYNNQVFINKLSEDKYKRDIFKHIVDEINSN